MTFDSILFTRPEDRPPEGTAAAPDYFVDLNLDQIIEALTVDKQEYNLTPFFYTPLQDSDAIKYRQEVAQDLENEALNKKIVSFTQKMSLVRRYLAMIEKLYYHYHKEGWFLEA
ncbi:MAG: DNA mismatch repair protein MutS, partial [Chloroflexota bacterium]